MARFPWRLLEVRILYSTTGRDSQKCHPLSVPCICFMNPQSNYDDPLGLAHFVVDSDDIWSQNQRSPERRRLTDFPRTPNAQKVLSKINASTKSKPPPLFTTEKAKSLIWKREILVSASLLASTMDTSLPSFQDQSFSRTIRTNLFSKL